NLKRYLHFHFFVQVKVRYVFAQYFGFFFERDAAAVYLKALLFEGIRYLDAVYRAENLAAFAGFGTDGQFQAFKLSSQFTGVLLDLVLLGRCRADLLCQYLLCRRGGKLGKPLWDEVVAAISGLHRYDVVFFTKFLDVLL